MNLLLLNGLNFAFTDPFSSQVSSSSFSSPRPAVLSTHMGEFALRLFGLAAKSAFRFRMRGFGGEAQPSVQWLALMMRSHCRAMPFTNHHTLGDEGRKRPCWVYLIREASTVGSVAVWPLPHMLKLSRPPSSYPQLERGF